MPSGVPIIGRIARRLIVSALGLVLLMAVGTSAWAGAETPFPQTPAIQDNVKFWVDVFANYGVRDFIVHDRDQVDRVYQVIHLPGAGEPTRGEVADMDDYLKTKYANALNHLATGQAPANADERHIAGMFKGQPLSAYTAAAQNLRVQQGLHERFGEGLLRSRYYRPTMERIFRRAGLPPELVTLASVESGFYSRAKSSAGAVGIWQFTRGTGKQYMRITRYHDDRFDPTTETRAAAELLRSNYDTLGSWPLAITAYNYGTGGTSAAAAEFGGDYDRIVRNFNGPRFGFAARNYYAEFLAALQVHREEQRYFPELKFAETPAPPPVKTDFGRPRRVARRWRVGSVHAGHATSRHSAHHAHRRAHATTQARNTRHPVAKSMRAASRSPRKAHSRSLIAEKRTSGSDS